MGAAYEVTIDGRGKLSHLTREVKYLKRDSKLSAWRSKNSLVIAWLINSIEPTTGNPHIATNHEPIHSEPYDLDLPIAERIEVVENDRKLRSLGWEITNWAGRGRLQTRRDGRG
ncbi:hypothetical protein ACH5RR_018347 [Cinchona calisaya]|uniref:Uncharacterized protein n=1 Tax=Cinchona calisaya TaxID=153742 RepID=A0ABD2ZLM3_9GENT